jgi:hypothetical protein
MLCREIVDRWAYARGGTAPVELGRHDDWVTAVAALPDGRVISSADDGRLLLWRAGAADTPPVELGRRTDDGGGTSGRPRAQRRR